MRASAKVIGATLLLLGVATSFIWYAAIREDHRGRLTVSFLNVGQGTAVFMTAPSGRTALIDGGPDDSVLRALGGVMPFYDRSIDIVIATAPQPQFVGGLTSVLSRYKVGAVVRPGANSNAPQAQAFSGQIAKAQAQGTRLVIAQRGQVIDLGDGVLIEFLFPDRDASGMAASDGCLMFKILFGNTSFLFACGSATIENYLATLDGMKLRSDVLLATGDDPELFVGFVSPQYAIVPCGTSATSSSLSKLGVPVLSACTSSITFASDGQTITKQ